MSGGANDGRRGWMNRHEMATAVLPPHLGRLGLGATALGMIEGIADAVTIAGRGGRKTATAASS